VYSAQSEANRRCDVHAASICEQAEQGLWKDPRTPLKRSEVRSREGFWEPEKTPGSKHPCRDRRDPRCGMPSLPPPLQPPSGPFFCLVALTRLMVHGDKTVAPAGKFPPPPVCIQFLRNEKSQHWSEPGTYLARYTTVTTRRTLGDLPRMLGRHMHSGVWVSLCSAVGLGGLPLPTCEEHPRTPTR